MMRAAAYDCVEDERIVHDPLASSTWSSNRPGVRVYGQNLLFLGRPGLMGKARPSGHESPSYVAVQACGINGAPERSFGLKTKSARVIASAPSQNRLPADLITGGPT